MVNSSQAIHIKYYSPRGLSIKKHSLLTFQNLKMLFIKEYNTGIIERMSCNSTIHQTVNLPKNKTAVFYNGSCLADNIAGRFSHIRCHNCRISLTLYASDYTGQIRRNTTLLLMLFCDNRITFFLELIDLLYHCFYRNI